MALLTVDQLFTPLTYDQWKTKLYDTAAALGLPTTSWFSGAPTRVLIAATATIMATFLSPLLVSLAKSGFLDSAEPDGWLERVGKLVYGVTRRQATYATGEVTLINAGGGIYAFEIGEALFSNSTTQISYTNTEAIALGAFGTQTIAVRATVPGSVGNAAIAAVDTIETTMPLVTVSNAAEIEGQDQESTDDYKQRCYDRLGALSPNGPAAAYRYVALTPELNGGANINRVRVLPALGDGEVTVILASPTGAPSGSDVTLVADAFDEWATPDIAIVNTQACGEAVWTVAATITVDAAAGLTDAEWEDLATDALIDWIESLPIGGLEIAPGVGIVPWRSAIGVLERVKVTTASTDYKVLHAQLTSEVDFSVADDEVATLTAGNVTITVVQVALP